MKNLVRGSVILSIISVFVVFIYAQTTETVSDIANDSQVKNDNNKEVNNTDIKTETNIEPTLVEVDKETATIKIETDQDPVKKTEDKKVAAADDKKLVKKTASSGRSMEMTPRAFFWRFSSAAASRCCSKRCCWSSPRIPWCPR